MGTEAFDIATAILPYTIGKRVQLEAAIELRNVCETDYR
jgi:hypothetical protein